MINPTTSSNWLIEGKLLIGRYPTDCSDLKQLIDIGVKIFVDLTEAKQENLTPYVVPNHCHYINFPMRDQKIRDDTETIDFIRSLYSLYKSLKDEEIMYIHCKGGLGRTGVIAGLLIAQINNITDYSTIYNILNESLKSRQFKMNDKKKMKLYKSPQTLIQIKQLKRLTFKV